MAWFRKDKKPLTAQDRREVPTDVFDKCPGCGEILYRERLAQNLNVCPTCGHHMRISAEAYLGILLDGGSFEEHDDDLRAADPLGFHDLKAYPARIAAAESKGKSEAVITGNGRIDGIDVAIAVMDFEFIGGSMGSVVGEKIARQFERAIAHRRPAILLSASGGARMQEGVLSLMQMAKTSAARSRMREAKVPYISVLLHPTTGGVAASVAMLGDIIIAEPGALIGFAGPRVIEQTIRQQLPPGFQRSEFLLEHGMVDMVVGRKNLKARLERTLRWFQNGREPARRTGKIGDDVELAAD
jgi:acetyl-CoA carboxylase carboxyl transferase subunit beta